MSPVPAQMRDRWLHRADINPGQGRIYWHVLLHDYPQVRAIAKEAQERLSNFSGLHMTPEKWLHLTTLVVGPAADTSPDQRAAMLREAARTLSDTKPIPVKLGHILYHPEAIMLGVHPERALDPILKGVQAATREATGKEGVINGSLPTWTPHITVAYSTAEQSAAPIVQLLGKELPARKILINAVSLVIQWGPERDWNWEPVGTVRLDTNASRDGG